MVSCYNVGGTRITGTPAYFRVAPKLTWIGFPINFWLECMFLNYEDRMCLLYICMISTHIQYIPIVSWWSGRININGNSTEMSISSGLLSIMPSDQWQGAQVITQTFVQVLAGAVRLQAVVWTNGDPDLWCHIAALGHNALIVLASHWCDAIGSVYNELLIWHCHTKASKNAF